MPTLPLIPDINEEEQMKKIYNAAINPRTQRLIEATIECHNASPEKVTEISKKFNKIF